MKKIIFSAVSALALAAFADGVNSTEFGVMQVPSSEAQTIVAVPWLESGTGTANVAVSNLVLTAGLNKGDKLSLYDGSDFVCSWVLNSSKQWIADDPDYTDIPRGKALMLVRTAPIASCFYIMGKPATLSAQESTLSLAAGSGIKADAVYSLIATPTTSAVAPNSLTWSGLTAGSDKLVIGTDSSMTVLTWKGDTKKWGTGGDTALPLGTGMWFKSQGTGTKTVSWQ